MFNARSSWSLRGRTYPLQVGQGPRRATMTPSGGCAAYSGIPEPVVAGSEARSTATPAGSITSRPSFPSSAVHASTMVEVVEVAEVVVVTPTYARSHPKPWITVPLVRWP